MTCPTCHTPMLLGESGWVCPRAGCEQRIVPTGKPRHALKAEEIEHELTVRKRGEAIRRGVEGMG